jgi:hypothetical protein
VVSELFHRRYRKGAPEVHAKYMATACSPQAVSTPARQPVTPASQPTRPSPVSPERRPRCWPDKKEFPAPYNRSPFCAKLAHQRNRFAMGGESTRTSHARRDVVTQPTAGIFSQLAPGKQYLGPLRLHPVCERDGHPPVIVVHCGLTVARTRPASGIPWLTPGSSSLRWPLTARYGSRPCRPQASRSAALAASRRGRGGRGGAR